MMEGEYLLKIGENQDDLEVTRKIKDVKNPDFAIKQKNEIYAQKRKIIADKDSHQQNIKDMKSPNGI